MRMELFRYDTLILRDIDRRGLGINDRKVLMLSSVCLLRYALFPIFLSRFGNQSDGILIFLSLFL